ncbi:MAG: hypothetical protein KGZ25_13485 [Planctomycetes bacterium]|nr:hypothetical protein [Planctomycetota bacterium]
MSFLIGRVNFRTAVSAWFATFLIYGALYRFLWPFATEQSQVIPDVFVDIPSYLLVWASPFSHFVTVGWDSESLGEWMIIGVALASLAALLLTYWRGLSQWKVMATSMLVWGFGMLVWGIEFNAACPSMVLVVADLRSKAIFEIDDTILWWVAFNGGAFLLDLVLGLVLLSGFDKLFARVSQ